MAPVLAFGELVVLPTVMEFTEKVMGLALEYADQPERLPNVVSEVTETA